MKLGIEYWLKEIEIARKQLEPFTNRAKDAWKSYVSESGKKDTQHMSIMWSNVQTLRPNLYFQRPKPKAIRRIKHNDSVSLNAAEIIEKATEYNCEEQTFNVSIKDAVEDYLITGRGVLWVSYEPVIETVKDANTEESYERVAREMMLVEHVPYSDFLHNPARFWREVEWVAKAVYLKRDDVKEVFGKGIAKKLTYDRDYGEDKDVQARHDHDYNGEEDKRVQVWEIWCRRSEKIYYVSECYKDDIIDSHEPNISFHEFFPCPRPLYNTTDDKSLCAYGDFHFYQDQARGVDTLTARIDQLSRNIKWAGGVNKEFYEQLKGVLNGDNVEFKPIDNWQNFLQKGAYESNILAMPLDALTQALMALYDAREREKQEIYEITGISDLVRGHSSPQETATAQQIKGQYANLRLADRQQEIQRFVRDAIALCAEGIAEKFQPDILAAMCGQDMNSLQFQQSLHLLRDDRMRTFAIDIETDSTLKADQAEQKQSAMEFAQALAQMVQQFSQVPNPALMPVFGELVMFVVRRFGQGRELEEGIEQAVQQMVQQAQQPPPPPPPNPQVMETERKTKKDESDAQLKSRELDIKEADIAIDAQLEAAKIQDGRQQHAVQNLEIPL